jgi:DNA (cytosine-5)-methyltransferase 1
MPALNCPWSWRLTLCYKIRPPIFANSSRLYEFVLLTAQRKRMGKTGVWDPQVKVEGNTYNWKGDPFIRHLPDTDLENGKPVLVDLFCGCGGFSVGFESAGFQSALGLDIHPPSLDTYAHNHPLAATICGDIRLVNDSTLQQAIRTEKVDVLTAGVPCQGFSLSNRKRHANDERNFLFREFIRVARLLTPTAVVLENVSGIVSSANGEFKRSISDAIRSLGYDVYVTKLDAADYGVAQRRQRIFFVGVPQGTLWRWPAREFGPGRLPHRGVWDAMSDLPALSIGESADTYRCAPESDLQRLLRGDQGTLFNHVAPSHPPETVERIGSTPPGKPMYPEFRQRIRLHPNQPSPTQICGGIRPQFQFGHPFQPRGLSIRERARIQSFPDRYFFHGGLVQGRVQTGNAVPPLLAQALASQLLRVLRGEPLVVEPDADDLAQYSMFSAG